MKEYTCTCGVVIKGDDIDTQVAEHQQSHNNTVTWWEIVLNGIFSPLGGIVILGIVAMIADAIGS